VTILTLHYAPEPTGNAPYTASLAVGLKERGHDVHVITAHPHYPEWRVREGYGGWSVKEVLDGVPVHRLAHYVPAKPTGAHRLAAELSFGLRLLFAPWHRPDVVLLVSPALFSTSVAMLRARLSRTAVAAWVQDLYSLGVVEMGHSRGRMAAVMTKVESSTLKAATGVAVIHRRFRDHVVRVLGVPEARVEVIRNWSHVQPPAAVDRETVRKRFGWAPATAVALHAGNIGGKQGLENVVEAARIADERRLPVHFVVLGNGNQRERIEALAAGVQSIEFIDPLPAGEFEEVLGSADVLLVNEKPGLREMSVPSKLTTYFATSLPVVAATDAGSVTADEIDASGGGVRVDAGNPGALVDAVLTLHADPERAGALGAAGRRYRDEVLSADAAMNHFGQWLEGLVEKRGEGGRRRQ
jgi:colanic acid biosynthesis glycosyl transferase WcaI